MQGNLAFTALSPKRSKGRPLMGLAITVESDRRIQMHRHLSASYAASVKEDPLWIEPGPVASSYLLGGRLDASSADRLAKLTPPPGAIDVMLDTSQVTSLDRAGIRAIVELASRSNRVVVLTRLSGPVRAALGRVGRDELPGIVLQEEPEPAAEPAPSRG
jgi:anti-anti-sigma regulatory factor